MFRQSYNLEHCVGGFNNKKRVPIDDIMRMSHQEFLAYEGQFEHKLKGNKIEFEARIDRLRSQTILISTAERPMFVERIGTIEVKLKNSEIEDAPNGLPILQDRFSTHRYTTPKFKDENYPQPEVMLCIVLNQLHNQRKQIGFRCEIHGHL